MRVTKRIDLPRLQSELATAGIDVPGLSLSGELPDDPGAQELTTHDADGHPLELPPGSEPVVLAHVAPPLAVDYAGAVTVDAVTRTTDDQAHEAFRFPTQAKQVYAAEFRMMAVDATSGATKRTRVEVVFKRPSTSLVQVGALAVLVNFADTATASWAITATVDGTDLVISVRGAAGRTVDWLLGGHIGTYAPGGLER